MRNNIPALLAAAALAQACAMETPRQDGEPPLPSASAGPAAPLEGAVGTAAPGAVDFVIPLYRPVPPSPDAVGYDTGEEGRIVFAGGCITLVDEAGRASIPIFPEGTAWEAVGERLRVQGAVLRSGDRIVTGGSVAAREFWKSLPADYPRHVAVPARCTAARYLLLAGPVRVVKG